MSTFYSLQSPTEKEERTLNERLVITRPESTL